MSWRETFKWKGLKSIEFRILWWMLRAAGVMAFLGYLVVSLAGTFTWAQIMSTRAQAFSRGAEIAAEQGAAAAERWIFYRPGDESQKIIETFAPLSGPMSPAVFLNFSDRAFHMGDMDRAKFWNMMARFRLRYDLMRCGMPEAVEKAEKFLRAFAVAGGGGVAEIAEDEQARYAREVLDFDAKYPAENDPEVFCGLMRQTGAAGLAAMPREKWEAVRLSLRRVTEEGLARDAGGAE